MCSAPSTGRVLLRHRAGVHIIWTCCGLRSFFESVHEVQTLYWKSPYNMEVRRRTSMCSCENQPKAGMWNYTRFLRALKGEARDGGTPGKGKGVDVGWFRCKIPQSASQTKHAFLLLIE